MSIWAAALVCLAPVAYDGDTLRCTNAPYHRARLFGISAPELRDPGGPEARDALQRRVEGGVHCYIQGASFSRFVVMCLNAQEVDVGRAQLEEGFATEWCSYSRNYYGTCP